MQNMQNMPPMHNMQSGMGSPSIHVGPDRQQPKFMDVPTLLPQPLSPMNNNNSMQSQFQVIALPVGAPPPEGAIAVGPMPAGADPSSYAIGGVPVQQMAPMPPVVQMIAVPMGEAPPEGAILVGEAPQVMTPPTSQSDSASSTSESRRTSKKVFKIKNPRTGLEVHAPAPGEETAAASRRLRIVNPKTGEEVCPSL